MAVETLLLTIVGFENGFGLVWLSRSCFLIAPFFLRRWPF